MPSSLARVRFNIWESRMGPLAQLPQYRWKDWWMGVFMLNGRRRMQGNARYEDAHRERDLERRKREREFRTNVAAWRKGRRDVHLW